MGHGATSMGDATTLLSVPPPQGSGNTRAEHLPWIVTPASNPTASDGCPYIWLTPTLPARVPERAAIPETLEMQWGPEGAHHRGGFRGIEIPCGFPTSPPRAELFESRACGGLFSASLLPARTGPGAWRGLPECGRVDDPCFYHPESLAGP